MGFHGMNLKHKPPRLQHTDAAAIHSGPLKSDFNTRILSCLICQGILPKISTKDKKIIHRAKMVKYG